MPAPLHLTLLGVPALLADGRPRHVGSRKALALLALLALDGATAREPLAQRLWPDQDATAARRNLRRELFRLRELGLALDAGEAASGTLALPPEVSVDWLHWQAAVAAADDERALAQTPPQAVFARGLDGLADAAFDDWLARQREQFARQREQFARQRLLARMRRAGVLEQAHHATAALALYEQVLTDDPCHEPAARAAMRLLAGQGERAAALAVHARLQVALRDDLGVAPEPATQALVRSLKYDAAPEPARAGLPGRASDVAAPAAPLAARVPYIARPRAQQQVAGAWAAGQRVYLSGVSGVGKTRLATECAAARGPWLRVACTADDTELPFASAVRVLRALLASAGDVVLPEWVRRELAQLLPELGPPPLALPTSEARTRLVAAFAAAWTLCVQDNFQTLVLDDWHWCDAASVELWNHLDEGSVAWLVVHRSAQLPQAALKRMRADVDAGRAVAIAVEGFSADDVLALVQALSTSSGGSLFARRLQHATGGNPFFLIETLRHLFERRLIRVEGGGGWSTPFDETTRDDAELKAPPTVRDAVLARAHALGAVACRVLEAASLLADRFDAGLLDGVTEATEPQLVSAIEHACAARLVEPAAGGYQFAHDLVRQCLAESLSAARRSGLHARLAARLEAGGAAPALVAAQLEQAGRPMQAAAWRQRAAEAAVQVHALADARHQYHQALADGVGAADAVDIHLALARLHRQGADAAAASEAIAAAVQAAAGADADTRLRARLACAEDWCNTDRTDECLALLEALRGDLAQAPPAQRARALALHARVLRWRGQQQAAQAVQGEAIELLEGLPDALAQQADLLDDQARASLMLGDTAAAGPLARRAVAAYAATSDAGGLAQALILLGVAMMHAGESPAATQAVLERARAVAAACGHVPAQRGAILNLIKLHTDAGRAGAALALLAEGEALAPGFEHPRAEQGFLQARYFVHYLGGEVEQADAAAQRLLGAARRVADRGVLLSSLQMVVDLYLHTARLDEAAALLQEAGSVQAQGDATAHTHVDAVLTAKRAWLRLAQGDAGAARQFLATAAPAAREEDRCLVAWVGAAAALACGDHDAARACLAPIDIATDTATDTLSMLLVQRLTLARATGTPDAAAATRASDLLAGARVPALEAQRLRVALG